MPVGVKMTVIAQLPPAGSELPTAGQSPKPPKAKSPLMPKGLVIVKGALPVLVSTAVRTVLVVPTVRLGKLRGLGEKTAVDEPPAPVRLAVRGLPAALSVTASVALRVPAAVGVKATLIAQLAPTARLELQPLV